MTYREHIYNLCKSTDMSNEEEATRLVQILLKDLMQYHDLSMEQEKKLTEIMSYQDFTKWSNDMAKKMFRQEIEGMADSEFKDFCLENFDKITE